jgi:CRISPR-associated exonuclease Cas4
MNTESLIPLHLRGALQTRLEQSAGLGDRRIYIGASEVGSCLRKVVLSKLSPMPFDTQSMGRMLAGKALENEVVQLVRLALNGSLRNTGRNQLEVTHPELPFRAHPDGRIIGEEGDGVLEVKTASTSTFKRYQSDGLPQNYIDQVQAQMGLGGLQWALVVLVSRENLSEMATFRIKFDPNHFAQLESRAARAATALRENNIQEGLIGEPERGFCHTCPYSGNCAIYQGQHEAGKRGEIAEVTRLQLECQLEELASLESNLEPIQERITEIRDQLKTTLLCTGASKVVLEGGTVQMIESSRTSFDSKSLQREAPEIYGRFQKTSTFSNLRITHRGESKCLSTAS